jgi:uncharacterized protein YdaU (DUF1376 family)
VGQAFPNYRRLVFPHATDTLFYLSQDELARKRYGSEHEQTRQRNAEMVNMQEEASRRQETQRRQVRISQSPCSASAIAHTRTRRDYSLCPDCLLIHITRD